MVMEAIENMEVENGTAFVEMIEEPITLLTVLSITAIISTVSLFFCGIPICINIWKKRSTDEISGFPFVMGFLGGSFWLRYGLLKTDLCMITVNVVGVTLMFIYMWFYVYYTKKKTFFLLQIALVFGLLGGMLVLVQIYGFQVQDHLGFACMSFNIINFGAPLAGVGVVLRKKCCDTLPLPLCTANFLVSSQWCLYGFLVNDIYIIIPNAAGMCLAVLQLSLFLIFPRKVGEKAVLSYCIGGRESDEESCDKAAIAKELNEKESTKRFDFFRNNCFRNSSTSCSSSPYRASMAPTIFTGISTQTLQMEDAAAEKVPLPLGEDYSKFEKIPEMDDEENWADIENKFAQSNATVITNVSEGDEEQEAKR